MNNNRLSVIKDLLLNTTLEISSLKENIEKNPKILQESLIGTKIDEIISLINRSNKALIELDDLTITPDIHFESHRMQKLMDIIFKLRQKEVINPVTLRTAILALQEFEDVLKEVKIDDTKLKRGVRVEKVDKDPL